MSARYLKKVLNEEQQERKPESDHEEEDADDDHPQLNGKAKFNPFDLLNDDDAEDHQEDDMDVDDDVSNVVPELKPSAEAVSVSSQKSKKKKKKKKKKGKEVSSSNSAASKVKKRGEEEFYAYAHEKQAELRASDGVVKDAYEKYVPSILQVDPKYLNADNEMRRIFGSKVVKSFEKNQPSGSSRMARGGRRGMVHRKSFLVTPSDQWPRWDGAMNMVLHNSPNGYYDYRYTYSSAYHHAQSAFESAKSLHDLNAIANILLHYPYHLDSLLTMAEYFKFAGEHQMSADAISRCLYGLECAWHLMFTPFKGDCQVKYSHEENKPLFVALFTHMKSMDRRGCHRSALEVCKFLMSLDTDDPMGALFCIDYFSVRAEEYAWLERFSEEYRSDNTLWLYPNFSYSLAICRLYLEKAESSKETTKATSTDLMKQALMLHPTVLKKLVAKVPLKERVWTEILKNTFFQADEVGIPSLDHLINIYVESNHIIWRLPELQKLLRDSAQLVIETLRQNSSEKNDWACVRKEAFSSDKNEYSHLLASNFSYTLPAAPPENLQHFMANARMEGVMHNEEHLVNLNEGVLAPRDVANRNPLAVLFESVLPWVHYGEGIEEENQPNGHGLGNEEE
ncbi:uncharacterized protein LOC126802241 [Argentina anserina]|uniref:uncharacterized protein LOC126802241 n=1 Tax=Argentina anserina TaxID=57926 RepID=UPI0021768E9C|nr:uncharacterized protein LOC126802241 [Potentilla anserina]